MPSPFGLPFFARDHLAPTCAATRFDFLCAADFTAFKWYSAKKGETLATVARRFGVSRADVAEANNLSAKSRLRPGQELIIPRAPATLLAARTERSAPSAVASRSIAGPAESPAVATPAAAQ